MPQFMRGKPGESRVHSAPIYDVVGWVTESEGAKIRDKIEPNHDGETQRTTISRWRSCGYVQGFNLNGAITLVSQENVIAMEPLPQGRPTGDEILPPIQDDLPEVITIKLVRRKTREPRKWKGEPKKPK